ncbi:MAG: M28 family peptidase [Firmicutes bacterium]|nr:M28 family peptidase [Bacillota bacterium]
MQVEGSGGDDKETHSSGRAHIGEGACGFMAAWDHLQALCRLGPRGSATDGERQAAGWLKERLESLGWEAELEPFRSPRHTLYLGPAAVIAGVLLARTLAPLSPPLAALGMVALLVPLIGEMTGGRLNFDRILPKAVSQNVVARLPGARRDDPQVVIVAHYDTQRGSWLFAPWFGRWLRPFFIGTYAALAVVVAEAWLGWLAPGAGWIRPWAGAAAVWLGAALAFLIASWATGRYVEGANDNGSGVAAALSIAERWKDRAPQGFSPVLLFTGCEETGMRGMSHFLRTARPAPGTVFVNLDNVGGGRLRYLLGEGMLVYRQYDAELVRMAAKLAQESGGEVRALRNLLLPTDGLLAAKSGYPAITFLAASDDGSIPNYHWHSDVSANVDRRTLETAETFVWRFLEELTKNVLQRRARPEPAVPGEGGETAALK